MMAKSNAVLKFINLELKMLSKKVGSEELESTVSLDSGLPFNKGFDFALRDLLLVKSFNEGKAKEKEFLNHLKVQKRALDKKDFKFYLETMQKNLNAKF